MLFTISALRSYPEAAVRAVLQKPHTSPGRRSETNATESRTTTDANTKLFIRRYCCLREHQNGFVNEPCSGMLRNRKKLAKTVRPLGVLMLHFHEKYPGRSRSTLYGDSLSTTSRQRECARILRFMTSRTEIPTFTFC